MRQDLIREVTNEPQNTGGEQWDTKPELGATEVQRPNVRLGGVRSTTAWEVIDIINNSLHEPYGARRNVVEVPGNPVHEIYDTRPDMVEIPGNPVHELSNT
jgi:hypothetical protein